jgi:hypothetical protein
MTVAEIEIAAKAAEVFPPEHGTEWIVDGYP